MRRALTILFVDAMEHYLDCGCNRAVRSNRTPVFAVRWPEHSENNSLFSCGAPADPNLWFVNSGAVCGSFQVPSLHRTQQRLINRLASQSGGGAPGGLNASGCAAVVDFGG